MIIHADINAFYASCEQLFRPDLWHRPVMVLSNNDGCVIALNSHAKKLGFKRGDFYFQVEGRARRKGVAVFSSNYTLYADMSRRVNSVYMEFNGGDVEPYSIDESFLTFPDVCQRDMREVCTVLRKKVMKEVGMPICVGAAPTKTLAKWYNKHAKAHGKVYVYDPATLDGELARTPAEDVWGIGRASARKLKKLGITNAFQLKRMDLYQAKDLLTVTGFAIVRELNGIPCIDMVAKYKRDIISCSRMFGHRLKSLAELRCAAAQYVQLAVEKLLRQQSEAAAVTVFVTTGLPYQDFESTVHTYTNSCCVRLPRHTALVNDINRAAQEALSQVYRSGYGYRSLMVTLSDLQDADSQLELFADYGRLERERRLMSVWQAVNSRYGRDTLVLAQSGSVRNWQMKREHLSPCYTTRLEDAVKI